MGRSPFIFSLVIALVCLNLPSKLSAQYIHPSPSPAAPPTVPFFALPPKKHKQLQWPLPPVAEPIVPYFPFVDIPSPSEKPYKHIPPPMVPYFPFVYIPSPSEKPYDHTPPPPLPPPKKKNWHKRSQSPPPVAAAEPIFPYFPFTFTPLPSPSEEPYSSLLRRPVVPYYPFRFPPPPLNNLPPRVSLRKMPPWPPNFIVKSSPPPF